jgi:hypothetical protein
MVLLELSGFEFVFVSNSKPNKYLEERMDSKEIFGVE